MNRSVLDLHARSTVLSLGHVTRIMGIVNCTPDSFSGDGRKNAAASLSYACKLIREGADMIDIGGESTRPGASQISLKEEIKRVIPVINGITRRSKVLVSVDTSKLQVAQHALDAGASIINNIQGTKVNASFLKMVHRYDAAIVLMHMRGIPSTMDAHAKYKNVIKEVIQELKISVEKCLAIGIKKNRIIIDPGIGFAKTLEHNLTLIKHLDRFDIFRCPVLLGSSRKSFIGRILNKDVSGRLMGTVATVTAGVMQGAHIVRVHDVRAVKETLKVTDAILSAKA